MNLHVTNDNYGLYPAVIAERIKNSQNRDKNVIINLSSGSTITHSRITYIHISHKSFKKYADTLTQLDKIILHPYNLNSYRFLKVILKKFPNVKVYWVFWSYELYSLPHLKNNLYDTFSARYIASATSLTKQVLKNWLYKIFSLMRIKKPYEKILINSYPRIDFFCSALPSDFRFLKSISSNENITYLPFCYLSLEKIMPNMEECQSRGDKIMIGHSSAPDGNHYEIIEKLSEINPEFSIFLPLAYGDKKYGSIIIEHARKKFNNLEILQSKLESLIYYQKLTEVGWAIINAKVQQGLGNIIALIWMGAKVFLDKNVSTYKDFSSWGIILFNIQDDLNEKELNNKLTVEEIANNRNKIFQKYNENQVSSYWECILN